MPDERKQTASFQQPEYLQDRCWAIPVVAACVIFLTTIVSSSKGYMYVLYMDHYVVDHETASRVDSTFLFTGSLVGFGMVLVQHKFSLFFLTMLSVAAVCTGLVGGAFCPDLVWLSVAIGGVYGAGYGATLTCLSFYTLLYFDKYKATATGVKFAAQAASGLAAPHIMPLLVGRYGLQGALLLCGALAMQAAPLMMLIRQPRPLKFCSHINGKVHRPSGSEENKQAQRVNAIAKPSIPQIPPALPLSSAFQSKPAAHIVAVSWKSVTKMLSIGELYVLLILYFTVDWTLMIHATTVVDYGRDKGALLEDANYLQTYGAAGELVGRLVVPVFSDKVPFGHCLFAAAGLFGSSLTLFGMTFNQTFACFATLNALFGACLGYVTCMRSVLITNYLGLERLPLFYGIVGLALIPASLGNPIILGFFRDTLGSYDSFYRVFGAVNIVVSVPLFCITFRDRARKRDWEVNHEGGLPEG
ncbi:monocarboxylate transporter 12-like [Haemaphysalis longicornis]